jgi:16S rRNA U516 pseudouridylate synthase RsuA-like enzyme
MWWALGYRVIDLERVRIGPVLLGDLAPGKTRRLTEVECAEIEAAVQLERGRPRS